MNIKRALIKLRRERQAIDRAIIALEKIETRSSANKEANVMPVRKGQVTLAPRVKPDKDSPAETGKAQVIDFRSKRRAG
jgi:hypothetical protein